MPTLLGGYFLGLVLGLRHALEPDHLMAISTLLSEKRQRGHPLLLGATWGLGHTLALFVVGGGLALLQHQMPRRWEASFEAAVGAMLIFLGTRAVLRAVRESRAGPDEAHLHGKVFHHHTAIREHLHGGPWIVSRRPLLIGLVHGLAGSGAITALVLAELPGSSSRLIYIALFGLGSLCGMGLLTWVAGSSVKRLSGFGRAPSYLLGVAGTCSSLFGLFWMTAALERL